MPFKDPNKQRDHAREWARRNKAVVEERRAHFRELIRIAKSKPCEDCKNTFPPICMDFDHRDGELKVATIASMKNYNQAKVLEEIAKCDLVCANCHRIRTQNRDQYALGKSNVLRPRRAYRFENKGYSSTS